MLLLFVFRDIWKEWGDSNFQIFSQNCQFHHRQLELLEHFNVYFFLSTTVSFLEDTILFLKGLLLFSFYVHFHFFFTSTICICVMYLTSFDGLF